VQTTEAPFAFLNGRIVRQKVLVDIAKAGADPSSLRVQKEIEEAKPNPTYIPPHKVDEIRMREVLYRDIPRRHVKKTQGKGNQGGGGKGSAYSQPPRGL
jgi:hypothetical protein